MKVNWKTAYNLEAQVAGIVAQQEINGWKFDRGKGEQFVGDLSSMMNDLEEEALPSLRKILSLPYGTPMNKPFLKSGGYSKGCRDWYERLLSPELIDEVGGPFTRVEWNDVNLGSDKQVKEVLLELGWVPTEWNYKKKANGRKEYDTRGNPVRSSPKLTEESYGSIPSGVGPLIAKYLQAKHRRSSIEGWLRNMDWETGLIHAYANPLGTPTGRFTHSVVVNVPKPKDYVFFGKEMRSLFTCRAGNQLVGHDFSGLEARVMAHYLDDPDLTAKLIYGSSADGTDFHSYFWEPLKDFIDSRDNAKNLEYA